MAFSAAIAAANRALREAASRGDIGAIRAALAEGADDLRGALIQAAERGQVLAASYLVDAGADPDGCEAPVSANIGNPPRHPLLQAIRWGRLETAKLLLDRGADPHFGDGAPLSAAVWFNHLDILWLLLERAGDGLTQRSLNYALLAAARMGRVEAAIILLDWGADVHFASGPGPDAPLCEAVIAGHKPMVNLLLEHGANPRALTPPIAREARKNGHSRLLRAIRRAAQATHPLSADPCAPEGPPPPLPEAASLWKRFFKK